MSMISKRTYLRFVRKSLGGLGLALFFTLLMGGVFHAVGFEVEDREQKEILNKETSPQSGANLKQKWGVEIVGICLSANGYMLDFRYHVADSEKASPLFTWKVKPYLVDQASGAKFLVPNPPKVGSLRSTRRPESNRNYFMLFANPGQFIKKGSKVTIVMGDFKAENLVVE